MPTEPESSVEVVQLDGSALIRLVGDIDLASQELFLEVLEPLCAQSGATVELDLSKVSFIDSSGLFLLVKLHRISKAACGALLISKPSDRVQVLFDITGAQETLTVVNETDWPDASG